MLSEHLFFITFLPLTSFADRALSQRCSEASLFLTMHTVHLSDYTTLPFQSWEWEPAGSQCRLTTPTAPSLCYTLSKWKTMHVTVSSHHRTDPTKQSTPPRKRMTLCMQTIIFNVWIQLIFSIFPRAPHYTLPFLLRALVWSVSGFYLHFLRPP